MQSLKQCTWILSQSYYDDESMMEMSGGDFGLAHKVAMLMEMAKDVSHSRPWGLNRSPHEIEPLYPFTGYSAL